MMIQVLVGEACEIFAETRRAGANGRSAHSGASLLHGKPRVHTNTASLLMPP